MSVEVTTGGTPREMSVLNNFGWMAYELRVGIRGALRHMDSGEDTFSAHAIEEFRRAEAAMTALHATCTEEAMARELAGDTS